MQVLYHARAMTQDLATPPLATVTPATPQPGSNLPEFTVSDLSRALKRTVEESYPHIRVRGEISQPKRHSSGHLYLRLKDEGAVIDAVCWRGQVARLAVTPEEGMEVVVVGRLTTYPGRSQYQLIIEAMELAGEGAILKMLEDRRKRLAAEGLFDSARKRPLPFLPTVIGVITSPTGAVIRDILHRLSDRFPCRVLLWPVAVQGNDAAEQIAAAIAGFNVLPADGPVPRPDLLIVARGGGSLEDLMAFNEEIVVRAAAASTIALISAVGHETDTTLIDHAADRRAPTPTAAAEMAVPVRAELTGQVMELERRLYGTASRMLEQRRRQVDDWGRRLGEPQRLIDASLQRLDDRGERLHQAMHQHLERKATRIRELAARLPHPRQRLTEAQTRLSGESRALDQALRTGLRQAEQRLHALGTRLDSPLLNRQWSRHEQRLAELDTRLHQAMSRRLGQESGRLAQIGRLLESYSYHSVLERGFALVTDAGQLPVTSASTPLPGQPLTVTFHDGSLSVMVDRGNVDGGNVDRGNGEAAQTAGGARGPTTAPAPSPRRRGRPGASRPEDASQGRLF